MKTIYLDYASTTPIKMEVAKDMLPSFSTNFGNPSSLHKLGIENKKAVNEARISVAKTLNANASEIFFCSGGTEAINWAIKGCASANPGKSEIIVSKVEHPSTVSTCLFMAKSSYKINYIDVDHKGFIDLRLLEETINENTLMVSIIWGNNEIGTVQDIDEIVSICQKHKVILHVDAIQIFGKLPIDLEKMKIDLLSLSSHKFYGPKGIGCLFIRKNVSIDALIHGGSQERKMRAGTENVSGIIGFASSAVLAKNNLVKYGKKIDELASRAYKEIFKAFPQVLLNGPMIGMNRLPGHLSLSFPDIDGNQLSYELDKLGILVSTGSACTSDKIEPSNVLKAIYVPSSHIAGTIRMTFGADSTLNDIPKIVSALSVALHLAHNKQS